MCEISICIGNYGAYNEGHLIDRWVDLPMPEDELNAIIADMRREAEGITGTPCEEFYVSDYDGMPFGISHGGLFGELSPIHEVNMLAHVMESCPRGTEVVQDVLEAGYETPDDIVGLANWIAGADEIPYYGYDCPEWCDDAYEKIGYTYLSCEPWYISMAHDGADAFFDVAQYGEVVSQGLYLGDDGYVDASLPFPDQHALGYDELMAYREG